MRYRSAGIVGRSNISLSRTVRVIFRLLVVLAAVGWQHRTVSAADVIDVSPDSNSNAVGSAEVVLPSSELEMVVPFGDAYFIEDSDGRTFALELDAHGMLTGAVVEVTDNGVVDRDYTLVEDKMAGRGYVRSLDLARSSVVGGTTLPPPVGNSVKDTSETDLVRDVADAPDSEEIVVPYGNFYVSELPSSGRVFIFELTEDHKATGKVVELVDGRIRKRKFSRVRRALPGRYVGSSTKNNTRTLAADDGICDCDVVCTCYSRYLGIKWDVRAAKQVNGKWVYGSWGRVTRSLNFGLTEGTSGKGLCQCGFEIAPTHRELYGTTRIEAGPTLSLYKESYASSRFDVSSTFTCNNG